VNSRTRSPVLGVLVSIAASICCASAGCGGSTAGGDEPALPTAAPGARSADGGESSDDDSYDETVEIESEDY
jgi:hypothetical protein